MSGGRPSFTGGSSTAVILGLFCAGLFCVPAWFVSSGNTIAGDKQKESAEDVLKLDPNVIQRAHEEKNAGGKPR